MKTVLFISYLFPPQAGAGAQRARKLAKYLARWGWRPLVLAAEVDPFFQVDKSLLDDVKDIEVIRVPANVLPRALLRSRIPRLALDRLLVPDLQLGWLPHLKRAAEKIIMERKPQAVFTTCAPFSTNAAGAHLKKKFGLPWVTDFRDPWVMGTTFQPPTPLHRWLHVRLEKRAYQACDVFVANTPLFLAQERKRYLWLSNKSLCIPNGYDPEDVSRAQSSPALEPGDAWHLSFAGSWHRRFYPDTLFSLLAAFVKKRPQARVVLHYAGAHFQQFSRPAQAHGVDGLLVNHGHLSNLDTLKLLQKSHVLLLTLPQGPRAKSWVPAKAYEYLATGRWIFGVCPPGDTSALIEKQGAFVPSDHPEVMRKGVADLEKIWSAHRAGQWPPRQDALLQEHEYPRLAERLADVLDGLVA